MDTRADWGVRLKGTLNFFNTLCVKAHRGRFALALEASSESRRTGHFSLNFSSLDLFIIGQDMTTVW